MAHRKLKNKMKKTKGRKKGKKGSVLGTNYTGVPNKNYNADGPAKK